MSKDPAFLFYSGDWLGGTMTFSRSHKGAYMDLLVAQHMGGHMAMQDIKDILNGDYETMWESKLKSKFIQDEDGLWYNERLDNEIVKRKRFAESRRTNLGLHMDSHMENTNRIKDVIKELKQGVEKFSEYSEGMREGFLSYWTEPNKSGTKLRFELEKTWDLSRRLATWARNDKNFNRVGSADNPNKFPEYYSEAYARKISDNPRLYQEWEKFLISKGWAKSYSPGGGTVWNKPKSYL